MEVIKIIIITLLIYSSVSTMIYFFTNQNDDILCCFGLGIVGNALVLISYLISKVLHFLKYHNLRSIIRIEDTGELKYCKLSDTDDIYFYHRRYKLEKRYAKKEEWKNLSPFNSTFILSCKRNCNYCEHNRIECDSDRYLCQDFDNYEKFQEKKRKW